MKPATRVLLNLIEALEERGWEYDIHKNVFSVVLGNVLMEAYTFDEESLQDILDDIEAW